MSLLMKALEKAAQDRHQGPAAASPSSTTAPERELQLEPAATSNGPAGIRRSATADYPRSSAQTRAATVLNAQLPGAPGVGAMTWLSARPLYVFGALAGLFLLLYGGYVYVQIAHPNLLRKSPAPLATIKPPVPATNPGPADTAAAAPSDGASGSQLPTMQSVFASRGEPQNSTPAAEATNAIAASPPPPTRPVAAAAKSGTLPPSAPAQASAFVVPPSRIAVSRGDSTVPRVNPQVSDAYTALEAGRFETAQRLYHQVLRGEPANVDALLGLAAIAQHENRNDDAQQHFLAILNVEPRHALAQSGLVALMSRADPQAAESRLKQLLAREPSAPLYFNLGNLYAEQAQWPQAQQAYFQAHNLEPRNPDYAYNLAIGLEHLGQQRLALGFYRKAQQLASAKGGANFDGARIQSRISQLAAQFD